MKDTIGTNRSLRITIFAGIILLVISSSVLGIFLLIDRTVNAATRQQDSFNRILREYDEAFKELYLTEREFEHFNYELDRLEKRAISVESWLSIIKRRKALAALHPPSNENYRNSISSALKIYPSSEPIIAVAAAALVKNTALNRETEDQLRQWLPLITDSLLNNLKLGIHVILGDFKNPQSAYILPDNINTDGTELISVNIALLKTIRGNHRGAAADIQAILSAPLPSVSALRFAAEYYYDFGDLLRSAEIFSYINDEASMIRQADALYLAGFTDIASAIWNILALHSNEISLYNLALTTEDPEKAAGFLEKLVNLETISNRESRQFGLIRYSRLLDYPKAISLLRDSVKFSPLDYPYIDLEMCKRHAKEQILGRQIAETWLLLDRHEKNEELYKWAAWHFFFQRSFEETKILLDRMILIDLSAHWVDIYNAIYFMSEGNLDEAEKLLRSIPKEEAPWFVNANLGKILETAHAPSRAIEQYELASANVQNNKTAAKIQLRIARCFAALNRPLDVRRSLFYALDLDPDNLTARLELERY